MHSRRAVTTSAALFLLLVAQFVGAHELVLMPFKAGGIYALGEKAGWTATLPADAAPVSTYRYTN
jgi:hypothetical protein